MSGVARPIHHMVTVAIIYGLAMLHARWLAPEPYQLLTSSRMGWWGVFAATQLSLAYGLGLPEMAMSRTSAAIRGTAATVAAFAVIGGFQILLATPLLPRSSSGLAGIVLPIWSVLAWNLSRDADAWAATRERVFVVVERSEDLDTLQRDLGQLAERPVTVTGFLSLDEVRGAGTAPVIVDRATEARATMLVVDAASQAHAPVVEQAAELHRNGVRVRTLALFYEERIGKLPISELARVSLLFDVGELHRARYIRAKRVFDVAFALIGAVGLLVLLPTVAVLNRRWNPGPLVFRQTRVGKDGREFVMYKLRTMVPSDGAPARSATWTSENDLRITPLGRWLRRTHLDELPQVVNILRGDLSLVGPRPEQPHYVRGSDRQDRVLRRPAPDPTGPDRLGPGPAGLRGRRGRRVRQAPARLLLPAAPGSGPRCPDRLADRPGRVGR